jgi:hypothetical protein
MVVTANPAPVAAFTVDGMAIDAKEGAKVSKAYDPIPGVDGGNNTTPEDCDSFPGCDVIPITVNLPKGFNADTDEFFLTFEVAWDPQADLAGQTTANDLDVYIYEKAVDAKGAHKLVGQSAGGTEPEKGRIFTPAKTDYYMVVNDFVGVNTGFQVTLAYVDAKVFVPDESSFGSAPPGAGSSRSPGDSTAPTTTPAPKAPRPAATPYVPDSPSALPSLTPGLAPALTDASGAADPDFTTGFSDTKAFATSLRGANGGQSPLDLLAASRRQVGPPGKVPAALLVLWLGLVPILLGGLTLALLIRRRPAALTLAVNAA